MKKKILNAAIIGCGKVGHTHANAYKQLPQSNLIAVCDSSLQRAVDYGKEYGIKSYDDFDCMVHENDIDLISVCTPHPLHKIYIKKAAQKEIHVITEKPLAPDLGGCDEAIDICLRHNVKLGVISQRRFYPPIIRMKEAIVEERIGKPIIADLTVLGWRGEDYYLMDEWRGKWKSEGGGVLINQTIHQLDLLVWMMGPIEELFGYWDNFNHPYIEVDDTAIAVMRFKSGAIGRVLVSNSQNPGLYGNIHIHGSNGASIGAKTEGGSPFISGVTTHIDAPINDIWTIKGEENEVEVWRSEDELFASKINIMTYFHKKQIDDFLQAVQDDRDPGVTGIEARKSVELLTAIYRSQRDKKPIIFPLEPEYSRNDYDGRFTHKLFSQNNIL